MKRVHVATLCLVALIGVLGYRNRQSFLMGQGGIQNASCLAGQNCQGNGATCPTAGYTKQRNPIDGTIYWCNDLGHNHESKCIRTGHPQLEIGFPTNGPYHVGTPVTVNFNLVNFGSGDLVTKDEHGNWMQGGRVDWGDGLGPKEYPITGGAPFSTTYTFKQIGSTTIKALAWAQFK